MRYFLVIGVFLLLLCGRLFMLGYQESQDTIKKFFDTTGIVEGTVGNDPERRETSLHVHVRIERIKGEDGSGGLLVVLPRDTTLSYGDRVVVRGLIEEPQEFEVDGGRVFDYRGYLRVRGISAVTWRAELLEHQEGGLSLQALLYEIKHAFERSLRSTLPEPRESLLEGLLLGARRGLPEALLHSFVVAGLIHVIVLSGYNISIVAEATLRMLRILLPRRAALVSGGVAIVLFALMVGGGAATIRATVMGVIALLARYLRRPKAAMRALLIAAAAMALWNPLVVVYDRGFVLSVLATFGLITLSPWVESRLGLLPAWRRFNLRSIAASTIAVQIYLLPALLYFTGNLSLVALPANLLALPAVPFAMVGGFITGILGFLHPVLAAAPSLITDLLLRWVIAVAQASSALPFSAVLLPAFPLWIAVLVYVPLTVLALRLYKAEKNNSEGGFASATARD
jgi:competence protein ComEC